MNAAESTQQLIEHKSFVKLNTLWRQMFEKEKMFCHLLSHARYKNFLNSLDLCFSYKMIDCFGFFSTWRSQHNQSFELLNFLLIHMTKEKNGDDESP